MTNKDSNKEGSILSEENGNGVKFPILDEKSQSMFTCGAYELEPQKSAEIFFHITKISIKEKFMCCLDF